MKQDSMAGAAPLLRSIHPISFERCSLHWDCKYPFLAASLVVFCLPFLLSLPCSVNGSLRSSTDHTVGLLPSNGCASYGDFMGSSWGSSEDFSDVCTGSGSFCFPSMLMGFHAEEESSPIPSVQPFEGLIGNEATFEMLNGGIVSCHLKDTVHDTGHSENENGVRGVATCKDPLVSDLWIRASGDRGVDHDEHCEEFETAAVSDGSSPLVEINPTVLDWGESTLYTPSLKVLNVANAYNNSVLTVYDLFSTDPQFYVYGFDNRTLRPGESASFSFVFLPRWLGLSSAHLVMQTNSGGFIINAKGTAMESPYQIEPSVSSYGGFSRLFSLYNPSDNVLHVEEVTMWISISSQNISHSAHVVCNLNASHQSSGGFGFFRTHKEWLTVKLGEFGMSLVGIRPHKEWKVLPHNAESIMEMNLWPHFDGEVSGAICMQLQKSTQDRSDTVIVPFEVDIYGRKTCHDLTGSLSVFLEPHLSCARRGSMLLVSLRNDADYLVSVVNITEVTEGSKVFQLNYREGLILYPKTVTRIALISYILPVSIQSTSPEVPSINCDLFIVTNDSATPEVKIPCQDLVHMFSRYKPGSSFASRKGSYAELLLQQERHESMHSSIGSLGSIIEEPSSVKPKLTEVVEGDELILGNWRSQGTMSEMSVLEDHEVLFPVVQIGTHFSKWITVRNPSHEPVIMQLVLNSGAIVDQCKSDEQLSELNLLTETSHVESRIIQDGFSIQDSAITEAFVHPLSIASFGPVIFRPSRRCTWRSSAFIRSNLSGVEWLPLRGFGGSHSLILLEGSEAIRKLEFNLDFSIGLNISSSDLLPASASCAHRLSKELYAKNAGELPLEVLKLDISGSSLGGFTIDSLQGFALAPGDSRKVLVSYQADFSSAVVHRNLELAITAGIFVVPMKAILPVHMLHLCRRSPIRNLMWNLSLLLLAAVSVAFLVFFWIIPQVFSPNTEYCVAKNGETTSNFSMAGKPYHLRRNSKRSNSRGTEKPEAAYASRYSDRSYGVHDDRDEGLQHQKKFTSSPSSPKPVDILDGSDLREAPGTVDLTVHIVRERGRRRKRRATGATSSAKFEVSSSQSGNSTPSSPMSPNAATSKQKWPPSPGANAENPFSQVSGRTRQQKQETKLSKKARESEKDQPQLTGRPTLSFSATFPGPGFRAPSPFVDDSLASMSPIAPHARAPGSKLMMDKMSQSEGGGDVVKELVYDIWGNNFSDHFLKGRPKEIVSKMVFDASEGDSRSFFAREPQSLMMMSSAPSVSPGRNNPSHDVNHPYQMD